MNISSSIREKTRGEDRRKEDDEPINFFPGKLIRRILSSVSTLSSAQALQNYLLDNWPKDCSSLSTLLV